MDTRRYDRMEEEAAYPGEEHVQIHQMVTYSPETLETNSDITGQPPLRVQQRLLRCAFLLSITNAIVAAVCFVFASMAKTVSGSSYEPCMTVCFMVIIDSCLIWLLRYQGKRILRQGSWVNIWPRRIFLYCLIAIAFVAVCSVILVGIAIYVLERSELEDCQEAFHNIKVLDTLEGNSCTEESETRYFLSILEVTLLAIMAILTIVILWFMFSIGRKFSNKFGKRPNSENSQREASDGEFRTTDRDHSVIVTKNDENGRKVVYKYNDDQNVPSDGEDESLDHNEHIANEHTDRIVLSEV